MKKRILFTGGTGKAGRHVVPWLINAGYEVHNIDLVPLAHSRCDQPDRRCHRCGTSV